MDASQRDRRRARPGASGLDDLVPGAGAGVPGKATLVGARATTPLPDALRARLERALSTDLSAVRVGIDERVAAMGAQAVASGTDVLFAPGAYDPGSERGQQLIAHEVVHLTQQADRHVAPDAAVGDVPVNADPALETEADQLAERALRGEVVRAPGADPVATGEGAPVQGFFESFGKLGELAESVVDTATSIAKGVGKTIKAAVTGVLPEQLTMTEDHEASSLELQRILENGSLDAVEAALDGLEHARGSRAPMNVVDDVSFVTDERDYMLSVPHAVTDAMIPAMRSRAEQLLIDPEGEDLEWDPEWGPFADEFNKTFAGILHAFGLGETRNDLEKKQVLAARLQFLFTDTQRELLSDYMRTKLIPDRLFDGDEVGRASAKQRILISSQIIADGKYKPGSYTQEVHARFCYHWARIVYQYAGVSTESSNTRVMGNFDFNGGVVLGDGLLDTLFHGLNKDPSLDPSAAHLANNPRAYRGQVAPWSKVMELELGDWLYIYTQNKAGNGEHSVIFAGWVGEEKFDEAAGLHYRAAAMFDQGDPDQGGNLHHKIFGEDLFHPASGGSAIPVTEIMRVDPDAAPADSVFELTPALARKVGKKNVAFLKKKLAKYAKGTMTFDHDAFLAWLREQNLDHIDVIGDRLTSGQKALLLEANASTREADVIALNQRVYMLAKNSEILGDNMADAFKGADGLDEEYTAAMAAYQAQRTVLQAEWWIEQAKTVALALEQDPIDDRLEELERTGERAALLATRKALKKKLGKGTKAEREATRAELDANAAELTRVAKEAKAAAKDHRPELKELHREAKRLAKEEKALDRKLKAIETKLDELYPAYDYGLVHPGHLKGDVKLKIDGKYEHIPDPVPWDDFIVPLTKP